MLFQFEDYSLDTDRRELRRGSVLMSVEPQVFDLLEYLIRNRDRVVSKDDLLASVWRGRIVSDSTLASRINAARRAIGDDGKGQRLIRTIIGRGIRFTAGVVERAAKAVKSEAEVPTVNTPDQQNPPLTNNLSIRAERRQVTVMFCELVGSSELTAAGDPEDLREVLDAYYEAVAEVVASWDGFVGKNIGNEVFVYFGYPRAREHDAERAVHAALALIDRIGDLECATVTLACRVGIATGLVVVSDLKGPSQSEEYAVVGEALNLAARLKATASANAVFIAEATRRLVGDLFECQDLGGLALDGIAAPVRAWQALRESNSKDRFAALHPVNLSRLIGREEELDLLRRRWTRVKARLGQVVLLCGEAGLGKSRLVTALQNDLETEERFEFRYFCSPHRQDSALFPVTEQLGRVSGFVEGDTQAERLQKLHVILAAIATPQEDVALIADLFSLPAPVNPAIAELSPQQIKERTLEALIGLLGRSADRKPVLMVFEDVHWIDPTSREFLDLLLQRIHKIPLLLIVTYRPEFVLPWAGQPQVSTMILNGLDRRATTVLAKGIAGGRLLPPEIVKQIGDQTDGVPLFIEELTKDILESGSLRLEADRYLLNGPLTPPATPMTLQASLLARLDRLGPAAKTVAQAGAAIGRDFSYELLALAAPLAEPELQEALHRLVEAGLVFQRGAPPAAEYLFKHALVQDTAYSTLLRGPRQALHRRIAEALEQRFPDFVETRPEIVAHHYGEAAMPDKAIIYWHLAGKLSVAKSAVREAVAQLRRGLSLLDGLPETRERDQLELDIHVTLTQALMAGKGYADPEVVAALERANRLVTETASVGTPLHFSVLYGLWVSTANSGIVAAALEHATNFLSSAQSQPSSGPLLVGHHIVAVSLIDSGDYRAALAHVETAASLYRPDEHRDSAFHYGQDIGVSAFVFLSWALWHRGYPDQSARAADRALALSRQLGHAHTLAYAFGLAGRAAVFARNVATVIACSNDCVALASEHGFAQWAASGRILQGWAEAQRGEATTGIARIRDGLTAYEATGIRLRVPLYSVLLADALALAGKIEEGLATLDDALATAAVSGMSGWDAEIHRLRGELTARLPYPDPAKVEDLFRTALAIAREQGTRGYELRAAMSLARLWGEQGRRGEAIELLTPVYDWFTEGFDTADLKAAKALLDDLA